MTHEKIKEKTFYVCRKTNPSTMIYKHATKCCEEFDQKIHTNTLIPNIIPYYMVYEVNFAIQKPFNVKNLSLLHQCFFQFLCSQTCDFLGSIYIK
jgi:hypothetical protein